MADFNLIHHGSISTLQPLTEAASAWCDEHLPDDALWHGNCVAIEPRYLGPIVNGILDDGLEVQ